MEQGWSNHKLCRFYTSTCWLHTTAGPTTGSYMPTVAADGPPEAMFCTSDVKLLQNANKIKKGNRAFVINSTAFNTLMTVGGGAGAYRNHHYRGAPG